MKYIKKKKKTGFIGTAHPFHHVRTQKVLAMNEVEGPHQKVTTLIWTSKIQNHEK